MAEVENSLRRLGTDWIDLYQIHRPEPDTDIDETLGALTDLVRQGKVRYIGSSTFPAEAIVEAQWTAERRGRERFVCEQPPYSLLVRGDRGRRAARPASATGWPSSRGARSPAASSPAATAGAEATESRRVQMLPQRFDMSRPENRRKIEAVYELTDLADEAGLTMIQLALGFVLEHPAVTAPIIGPRTMEHLESQLAAADVKLSRRRPRPNRRDRPAGDEPQPRRRRLAPAGARRRRAAAAKHPAMSCAAVGGLTS